MSKATPMPGPSLMTSHCRHCGEKIERWSGGGQEWVHGEIGSSETECLPEMRIAEKVRRTLRGVE